MPLWVIRKKIWKKLRPYNSSKLNNASPLPIKVIWFGLKWNTCNSKFIPQRTVDSNLGADQYFSKFLVLFIAVIQPFDYTKFIWKFKLYMVLRCNCLDLGIFPLHILSVWAENRTNTNRLGCILHHSHG